MYNKGSEIQQIPSINGWLLKASVPLKGFSTIQVIIMVVAHSVTVLPSSHCSKKLCFQIQQQQQFSATSSNKPDLRYLPSTKTFVAAIEPLMSPQEL